MISAQLHKELMFIAGNLPTVVTNSHEKHVITMDEYQEMFEHLPPQDEIIPKGPHKGKVLISYPVQVVSNHYRRLKKAYLKNGEPGVVAYITRVKALEDVR